MIFLIKYSDPTGNAKFSLVKEDDEYLARCTLMNHRYVDEILDCEEVFDGDEVVVDVE